MSREQRKIADAERPTAKCARRHEGGCSGDLQVSHPYGRRIQERFLWIWECRAHHMGIHKNTRKDRYLALLQATGDDFMRNPKSADGMGGWRQDLKAFREQFGEIEQKKLHGNCW